MQSLDFSAAIFDMDGTLIDSMPAWIDGFVALAREHGYNAEPTMYEMDLHSVAQLLVERCMPGYDVKSLLRIVCDRLMPYYASADIAIKPGVTAYLQSLWERGVPMRILTANDIASAELCMERLGLARFFTGIISCRGTSFSKSAPEAFAIASEGWNLEHRQIAVFDDALYAAKTAAAAGYCVIGVYDRCSDKMQDELMQLSKRYITSFEELL